MIERSSISNNAFDVGAQCSPRHARTLKGSLLMQVHQQSQAAPELVLTRAAGVLKRMQNHAPYACMA
ncbi:UNVERIFIED_ORG: hypothetical protein M2154_003490 [Enterobacter sp. JUb101]|nr:hypothetical protein [Lelliottia amnigena]